MTDLAIITEQEPDKVCTLARKVADSYNGNKLTSNGVILIVYESPPQRDLAYEELHSKLKRNPLFYLHFRATKDRLAGDIDPDPVKDVGIKEILGKYPDVREKPHITIEEHFV